MSQKGFDFGEEPEERAEPARGARSADDKEAPKARSARPAAASSKPEPRRALSVSELTDRIQGVLETEFFDVWVEGEISNLKLASSGHWYFSLKDDKAQIAAVVWRNDARLVRFKPKDGMKVLARGQLRVYPPRGAYQLSVQVLEPLGKGSLQQAFEELGHQLVLAARGIHADGAAGQDLHSVLGLEAEVVAVLPEDHGADLGGLVLEGEVPVPG